MPNKAVIFDLNGVFIQSPTLSSRMLADYKVPETEFLPALSSIMDIVRKPHAPDIYELWQPHLKKWNINLSKEEFLHYWFSAEKENEEMVTYARTLQENGWLLFTLSNNFKERIRYYDKTFDFLDEIFDDVYLSCETGFVKPEEKAFLQILEEHDIKPQECYYFDDAEKNVLAAKKLGINAYRYEGLSSVKKVLEVK